MRPLREHIGEGLRHLTWSFIWKFLGAELLITAAATGAAAEVWRSIHALYSLPLGFYLMLALLIFCAMTLFAILVLILHRSVAALPVAQSQPPIPSRPSKLAIHSAFYGNTPENEEPVAEKIKSMPTEALAFEVGFSTLRTDPAANIPPAKTLRVVYSYGNDTKWETSAKEGEWIYLPAPPDKKKRIS
jgi:hypothetical protein